jgi:hypothetical protein
LYGGAVTSDTLDDAVPPAPDEPETAPVPTPSRSPFGALGLAAVASLAAGAIHATAVGSHAGDDAVVRAFVAVTAFQIGWGALALLRPTKAVAVVGALGNAACLGGWILAKSVGIGFIQGFSEPEPVEFADGLAAAMAAISVLFALGAVFGVTFAKKAPKVRTALVGTTAVVLAALALPGMVEAGQGHGDGGGHSHGGQAAVVVPPVEFDPNNVDLSGIDGVTPEQEQRAEELVTATVEALPQFADTDTAYAEGYRSIEDDGTGVEHYINDEYVEDDRILDPNHPESLMYRVDGDERILEAAMFMMPDGVALEDVPDIGGPMTQWHIHDNLCYSLANPDAPRVAAVSPPDVPCPGDLVRGDENAMIHVWIVPNECGPFAALSGIPGGSVPEGEERLCDHTNAEAVGNTPLF